MTKIHRDIKDIPAKSVDDPNIYEQEEHPLDYDFVRTPEKRALSRAIKSLHQNNPTQQITHFDGKHTRVIGVTPTQARCYNVVKSNCQENVAMIGIDWDTLRMLFRYSTVNVLVKKNLLKVVGNRVFTGTHIKSATEIMEKGGVGKLSITMPG